MEKKNKETRRSFIKKSGSTAAAFMIPCLFPFNISFISTNNTQNDRPAAYNSTRHFLYRKPPNTPYVDSQNKNKSFGFTENEILLSIDNSNSWKYRNTFSEADKITFSHIFDNGNILFATQEKLFLSKNNLKSFKEITVKDIDGTDYLPHTPQNPDYPGWYFHTLTGADSWIIDGKEMLVWGNYCNVAGGATPVNIYYSTDQGKTVKIAYTFGQNPYFSDNGSKGGGASGNLLGNPDNPVICRHIHSVAYNPAENAFYACTGDGNRPKGMECHWLRGIYDAKNDQWDWKVIITESLNSRYKGGGISFVDGKMYWISDANGPEPYDRGIFCCDPADIANPKKHTMLFNPKYETATMIIQDGVILATHIAVASPFTLGVIYSPDLGKTWTEYDIKEYGAFSPTRIHKKNSDGWFRLDLRTGWIDRSEFVFIKPK